MIRLTFDICSTDLRPGTLAVKTVCSSCTMFSAPQPGLLRQCRSDLTLVCSPYEHALLRDVYSIPRHKLCIAPFFTSVQSRQPLSSRAHFMTIGTWKHPPNRDGVHWLCVHIWPAIRQQLPDAQLHIYGSHMSGAAQQYHKPVSQVCRLPTAMLSCSGLALPAADCCVLSTIHQIARAFVFCSLL